MTIDEAYQLINYISNKKQRGNITPKEFNLLAPLAQQELLMKKYGNPRTYRNGRAIPIIGYSMNKKTYDDVRPFVSNPTDLTVTNNEADYPSDYLHIDTLEREDGTRIKVVRTDEIGPIRKSAIVPPTEAYPYAALYSDKIRIYPNISDAKIVYVRKPAKPNWDYTIVSGHPVYNASSTPGETGAISVDFEFPEECHVEICILMLQHISINLSEGELFQYSQVKESQGV